LDCREDGPVASEVARQDFSMTLTPPNKPPQPTPVGTGHDAVAARHESAEAYLFSLRMLRIRQKQRRKRCVGRVTIVEVLWMVLLIGGGVIGGRVGYVELGLLGAVIGLLFGLATGLLVAYGIAFLLKTFLSKRHKTKH